MEQKASRGRSRLHKLKIFYEHPVILFLGAVCTLSGLSGSGVVEDIRHWLGPRTAMNDPARNGTISGLSDDPGTAVGNVSMLYVNEREGHQVRCLLASGDGLASTDCGVRRKFAEPVLILQFGNLATDAIGDVKVKVYRKGGSAQQQASIEHLATGVMRKLTFPIADETAPVVAACFSYVGHSGARRWALFAGRATDDSAGVMTALSGMNSFVKYDDGEDGGGSPCGGQVRVAMAKD